MSNTASICWKEVRSIFAPPGAYALIVCAGLWFVLGAFGPSQLSGPIFGLTGFAPQGGLRLRQVALEIGFVRVAALVLLPVISMRLFVEEKRNRSIEILFTSPVGDWEIVWGKWLGGMCAYLMILALSYAALIPAWPWHEHFTTAVAAFEAALVIQACGLVAIGESLSAIFKHEGSAGWATLLVSMALLRWDAVGMLDGWNIALCAGLVAAGWVLTWRSIRSLREGFCG